MKYYFKAGTFPFNCSNEAFAEDVADNILGREFSSPEDALDFCKNLGFHRIFKVEDNGNWEVVAGYAPNGSVINDLDWKYLSELTSEMADSMPEEKLSEMVGEWPHKI